MTPVTPDTVPPDVQARFAATLEWLAKLAGSLGILWAFLAKVAKPWIEWRRKSIARTVRGALEPELEKLNAMVEREEDCANRQEAILRRQNKVFDDLDTILSIVDDTRDRMDEFGQLLDAIGLDSDRRSGDRRKKFDDMLDGLQERRRRERREE